MVDARQGGTYARARGDVSCRGRVATAVAAGSARTRASSAVPKRPTVAPARGARVQAASSFFMSRRRENMGTAKESTEGPRSMRSKLPVAALEAKYDAPITPSRRVSWC